MIVFRKRFCQCLIILSVTCAFCDYIEPTRNELIRYLLKEAEYDHNFPPSSENVTDVSVQLYITDFNSESDKDREIEFTLYLRINWTDPRLDFTRNKTTYDVIKFGDDIVDSLWMPDLYFLNERKSQLHGLFEKNQLAYIYKNGSVFYSGRFNIRLHCVMTFDKYPFDTQRCPIEIQSYAYSTDYVLLHWNSDHAVQIDPSSDSYKLKIPSQGQSIETRNTYPITGEFSTLRTEIQIPRPKGSYDMMITVPSIILVVTALTSFLLGDNVTPRIGVPTGTLISLFVQWSGTYSRLSLDSTSDYLDIWMCGHLGFLGTILLVNAFICHFKYKVDKDKKDRHCVRWCKRSAIATQPEPSSNSVNQTEKKVVPLQTENTIKRSKSETDVKQLYSVNQTGDEIVPFHTDKIINISASKTDMNQAGSSSKRENQMLDVSVQIQRDDIADESTGETDINQGGSSSKRENQMMVDSVQIQRDDIADESTGETDIKQAGSSSKRENQMLDDSVQIQRDDIADESTGETDINQKFHEAKENLNSDKRYKWAKKMFGENELENIYLEFVREKTENDFYNLLEEKKSTIFVQELKKGCCKCCDSCALKVKPIADCIANSLKYLDKHDLINVIPCTFILFAYVIFIPVFKNNWTSS